ncbi:MAG: endonuclease/exonuclease/phosphatase family protein [Candidatus Levybacteria bacterium]|nr:endonuclease/exonuclease/phosphatase family protein [Candidatus Levybacteria bacterium]
MKSFYSFILCLYGLILILSHITQGILPFEWVISFSPYLVFFSILLCLLSVILALKKKLNVSLLALIGIALIVAGTFAIGEKVLSFTTVLPEKGIGTQAVTLVSFNKYYKNTNYAAIDSAIQRIQPDIIGFIEIISADVSGIEQLKNFPYSQTNAIDDPFSFGIFSRYPLNKITIKQTGIRNVLTSEVTINDKKYIVLMVHAYPPVTMRDIEKRNSELIAIQKYINNVGTENVIIMGDFNTTPWSKTYDTFTSGLKQLKNTAKGKGLNFTWGAIPIQAHIDHIFVPSKAIIEEFKIEYIKGSDHRLIWSKVKL